MKPHFVVFKSAGAEMEPMHQIFDIQSDAEGMAQYLAKKTGKEHVVLVLGSMVYRCKMQDGKATIFRRPDVDKSKRSLKITEAIAQAREDEKLVEEKEREFKRKQRRGWYLAHKEAERKRQVAKRNKKKDQIQEKDLDNKIEAPDNSLTTKTTEEQNETRVDSSAASGEGRS